MTEKIYKTIVDRVQSVETLKKTSVNLVVSSYFAFTVSDRLPLGSRKKRLQYPAAKYKSNKSEVKVHYRNLLLEKSRYWSKFVKRLAATIKLNQEEGN